MSYCDVYVGDLDDPHFKWDGGDWNGNAPKALTPMFTSGHRDLFTDIPNQIERGFLNGKQTDWGAYVAIMKRDQILKIYDYYYKQEITRQGKNYKPKNDKDEVREAILKLDPNKDYGLVASEL